MYFEMIYASSVQIYRQRRRVVRPIFSNVLKVKGLYPRYVKPNESRPWKINCIIGERILHRLTGYRFQPQR